MTYKMRIFICVFLIFSISSCLSATEAAQTRVVPSVQESTLTPENFIPSVPSETITSTARPTSTDTPTLTPTKTASSTPETPTPEPFLPQGLTAISSENFINLQKIAEVPVDSIYALTFSQSGKRLATLSERWQDRSRFLEVWDLQIGEQLLFLDNLKNPWDLFFSVEESQLFVFYPHRSIEVYDLVQQTLSQTIPMEVDRMDYSSDRKKIATGVYLGTTDESTMTVLDLDTDQSSFVKTIPGIVMSIEFSPNGEFLIAGVQRGNHFHDYIWDITTADLKLDLLDYQYGLTFTPDNSLAAISKGASVNILSADRWNLSNSYTFSDPYRNAIPKAFILDGKTLIFVDRNNMVFMNIQTGKDSFQLENECDLKISPQGTFLLTWCYQSKIKVWGVIQ